MNRQRIHGAVLTLLVLVSGCSRPDEHEKDMNRTETREYIMSEAPEFTARKAIESYLTLTLEGKHEEAYSVHLSVLDREVVPLSLYPDKLKVVFASLFRYISANKVFFKVDNVTVIDKKAIVTTRLMVEYQGSPGSAIEADRQTFNLRLEDNQWRVFFNWASETEAANRKQQIEALQAEAWALRQKWLPDEAMAVYAKIIELDPKNERAKAAIADIALNRAEAVERVEYLDQMKVLEVWSEDAGPAEEGKKQAKVSFRLANNGFRTLSEVEVTVFFLGPDGATVAEQKFYPVVKGRITNLPVRILDAQSAWTPKPGVFFKAEVPSPWTGAVTARVTAVKFEF